MSYVPPTLGAFAAHVRDMRQAAKNAPAADTPPPLARRGPAGPSRWDGDGYDPQAERDINRAGRVYREWRRTRWTPDDALERQARDRPDCPVHGVRWAGDGPCWAQGLTGLHC